MHRFCRSRRDDDGAVAILVALLSVVLFGFGALVIDIGHAQMVRSQAQNAVDTASLAGVRELALGGSPTDVVNIVQSYVDENMGIAPADWTGCSDSPAPLVPADVAHAGTCISISGPGAPRYRVRVRLPAQHVPATFGGLFGVSSIAIAPIAKAQWGETPPGCGPCMPPLDSAGNPEALPPPAPSVSASTSETASASTSETASAPASAAGSAPASAPPSVSASASASASATGSTSASASATGSASASTTPSDTAMPSACRLPRQICDELPDPSPTAPHPLTPGVLDNGCPGPGIYEGAAHDVVVPAGTCVLKPGLYVFDNADLDVSAGASIGSSLTTDTTSGFPIHTGVTLVFYGKGTLSVEGHIGILDPVDPTRRDPLIASWPSLAPAPDKSLARNTEPIPGVAIVFDQFQETPTPRTFTLGDDFNITGTVYALDGATTWATNIGDCEASSACAANVYPDGTPSWIEVTKTAFADDDRVPTVAPLANPGPTTTSSPRAILIP